MLSTSSLKKQIPSSLNYLWLRFFLALTFSASTLLGATAPEIEVVTVKPFIISTTAAKLIGSIRTYGAEVEVYFEYGSTDNYGKTTTIKTIPVGSELTDVFEEVSNLIENDFTHVRLVASTDGFVTKVEGNDFKFLAKEDPSPHASNGNPVTVPRVVPSVVNSFNTNSATLSTRVNPNGGYTLAYYEFSEEPFATATSILKTSDQVVDNGSEFVQVSTTIDGLSDYQTYYYRIIALNGFGTTVGEQGTFTTKANVPIFGDGDGDNGDASADAEVTVLTTTSVQITGNVSAGKADTTEVMILYGTNADSLSKSKTASPSIVSGFSATKVTADLEDLLQTVTYYFKIKATNSDGSATSEIQSFSMPTLSGRLQERPDDLPASDRAASLQVNLSPPGIRAVWRLSGEQEWRLPGTVVSGMTSGDRIVEYRPVAGHIQPPNETVVLVSGDPAIVLDRSYTQSGTTGSGGLTVNLNPSSDTRLQWRLLGETDLDWKDGGISVTGLLPGNYVVVCKPVDGKSTPPPESVVISNDGTPQITLNYLEADPVAGVLPEPIPFSDISDPTLPYAFVGQIRSDVGSSTGFVVRARVVATVAHAVFDDGTLASATGLQWLFQRHREIHEPTPLIPRGFYTMTGYAAQRTSDDAEDISQGISTPASQHLDAAAMYFTQDAGRNGFSGYLASDLDDNEFLRSSNLKTLVGYPVESTPEADRDQMHATTPANIDFIRTPNGTNDRIFRTFITQDIRSTGGASGAPLCVLDADGSYYPAGIYLGGTGQTVVRAIDSDVVTLFGFAKVSGDIDSIGSGTIAENETPLTEPFSGGSLSVLIEPAGARDAGGGWRIGSDSYLTSGDQIDDLEAPKSYGIEFSTIPGFEAALTPSVDIVAGQLKTVTFTYKIIISPPVINSLAEVIVNKNEPLHYEITAMNLPDPFPLSVFSLSGLLPDGIEFDRESGLVSGSPTEAGRFPVVVGVSNSGGTDTKAVDIISLPPVSNGTVRGKREVLLSYEVTGIVSNLPDGLEFNEATGFISGIPTTAKTVDSPVINTVNGASQSGTLTFIISEFSTVPGIDTPLQTAFTIVSGANVPLEVSPTGFPVPTVQWYRGESGDITQPVPDATKSIFVPTPSWDNNTGGGITHTSVTGSFDDIEPGAIKVIIEPAGAVDMGAKWQLTDERILLDSGTSEFDLSPRTYNLTFTDVEGFFLPTTQPVVVTGGQLTTVTYTYQEVASRHDYWARVTNTEGSVDSPSFVVTVLPSSNADLSFLGLSSGSLSPAFNTGTTDYTVTVPNSTSSVSITPRPTAPTSTITINDDPTLNDQASDPFELFEFDSNFFTVLVTAQDGVTQKEYTVEITRAFPPEIFVGDVQGIDDISATVSAAGFSGSDTTVFFEYGPTPDYGSRTEPQQVFRNEDFNLTEELTGLEGNTTYYYRLGYDDGGKVTYLEGGEGQDSFTTSPPRATATTGEAPVNLTGASLLGLVNANGTATTVHFEYGLTDALGTSTPAQSIGSETVVQELSSSLGGLTEGVTYHYRIVAVSSAFAEPVVGETVEFTTGPPDGSNGFADSVPLVIQGSEKHTNIKRNSADLEATIDPNGGTADFSFEYGTTIAYGFKSEAIIKVNDKDNTDVVVVSTISNLESGRTYFYRVVAVNGKGTTEGEGNSFTTSFDSPQVNTGKAFSISTSVQVTGTVRAKGASLDVWFQYGTGKTIFPNSIRAKQQTAEGQEETFVSVDLENLDENTTYYYKLIAADTGETEGTDGQVLSFNPSVLRGLKSQEPLDVSASARQGEVIVNLLPFGTGSWRFQGEQAWRTSGTAATGLTAGDRTLEFRPVQGFNQPINELITVTVTDGGSPMVFEHVYYESSAARTGTLQVTLYPTSLADENLPEEDRAQWRLANAADQTWNDSGVQLTGLHEGKYLIECKSILGWDTPVLTRVTVMEAMDESTKITYFEVTTPSANPPQALTLTFTKDTTNPHLPYAHVGQIRSRSGSYSGFVVRSRVVATVAQAVFDEATMTTVTGLQWLLQRDEDVHEPKPLEPHGAYLLTGYDAQRELEDSPGVLSLISQDRNVAALYFSVDAGRGGFSGFLGSDETNNEFLTSTDRKILAGYPVGQGRMHATPSGTSAYIFTMQGKTFSNTAIRGSGGMAGGPLCVQYEDGAYFPAGIYLGGTTQGYVRAIDTEVIDLLILAEESSNTGKNNTSGGASMTSLVGNQTTSQTGGLTVIIEPAAAIAMGAGWKLGSKGTQQHSGNTLGNLSPGSYDLIFAPVEGFFAPTMKSVTIIGGETIKETYIYHPGATALDTWRQANFNSSSITGIAADGEDPDKDGVTNIDEFTAGTDPKSGTDFFKLTEPIKSGSTFTVGCAGKAGRIYTLQRNTGLSGMWTDVTTQGPLASDAPVSLQDPAAPADVSFYRIQVSVP